MSQFSYLGKLITFQDSFVLSSKEKDISDTPEYGLVDSKNKDITSSFLTDADSNEKKANNLVQDLEVGTSYPGGLLVNKIGKYKNLGKEKPKFKGLQPKLSDQLDRKRNEGV